MRPVYDLLLTEPADDLRSWQAALGRCVSSVPIFLDRHAASWYQDREYLHEQVPDEVRLLWQQTWQPNQVTKATSMTMPFGKIGNLDNVSIWWNTPTCADHLAPLISTSGPWLGAPCVEAYGVEDDYLDRPCADEIDPGKMPEVLDDRRDWVPLAQIGEPRVYEIAEPTDWVRLVAAYPFPKALSTSSGSWPWSKPSIHAIAHWLQVDPNPLFPYLEPDWARVAADFDVVHVTQWAYLQTAYTYQRVGNGFTTMSGWGPDFAVWLHDPRP